MKMLWVYLLLPLRLASSQLFNETENFGNIIGNPCTDKNHLFLAPGVLTAGSTNRACISRFFTDGPARVVLSLLTEDRQTVTASRELPSGDGGCLDLNVPSLPNSKADLIVNIRYPEAQCVWERRVPLRISSGRVVVLSTERARYRPGELLRFRVLALRQDLAPSHGSIEEVWLEGPHGAWEGSRVTQWQEVRTRQGIAQLQYQLDELAPTGKWTLRAKLADGSQGSTMFWVGNYELPPFQLSVRHAPKVLRTSDRLVWTVCVRYPWSEAVEGMLVIRIRGAGGGSGGIRTAVQLRAPKACHRHAAAAKRIGLDGSNPPDVVVADFSFQEEGTRIWQNTTVVSQVVDKPITLEFLTKHRAVLSPGLPYKLKVKATRWDDKPALNELVRVCRYPTSPVDIQTTSRLRDSMCAEGPTDASGVARLLFAAGDDAAPFYRFEAHLSNDTRISAVPLTLPVSRSTTIHAALGALKAESRQARTFVPLFLNLHTNSSTKPYTVHFVVITRGGIIYRWGATTQCPTSNSADQVRQAPRNSKCNANYVQRDVVMSQRHRKYTNTYRSTRKVVFGSPNLPSIESTGSHDVLMAQRDTSPFNVSNDVSDALLDRHQLRVMLPIKVSHQMCPDSHLIAYFYHEGELISASKHFEMDECFVNKVEATWLNRQAQPGSTVSLQISTPGPALCALTVLDTVAKWTEPLPSVKEQLIGSLRRLIDSHRNLTEYDLAGVCFLNNDSPDIPTSSVELTASWMATAGVRVVGGDLTRSRHCISSPPALLVSEETTIPRSDFSEAWLWRLIGIGANGTGVAVTRAPDSITRFEASAVCMARNGVAISAPAVLQVFREFFIHADSPKRLRRGDYTIIRYRIFNYLYEPLSVQIQILTDANVEGPKEMVESACVKARSSIARRFEIRARVAAPARISIRAKAVSDGNCGNVTSGRTGVSDEVIIRIAVEPEGVPIREQKSMLLCGNSSTDTSEVLWNWPPVQAVPGTETLTVWAVGDMTGPLLADADSLLQIPRGCGEQNMAQLATNLLALNHLEPSSIAALTAKENVARGFTRQLQYVHPSGGFSAFGPSDATSSTWLTAFVVKHMRKAHKLLWPNLQVPPAIIRAERWLLNQQMENGCFRNEGQVFHRELRGGLNDDGEIASVALTAYVITALIESSSPLPHRVIHNTLACLRVFPILKSKTPTRVYAHALLAYAYVKLVEYEQELRNTNEASMRRIVGWLEQDEGAKQVMELLKVARKNGEFMWWEASSLPTSIEATSYALLALLELRGVSRAAAPAAARWLNAHRTTSGGFISTQDTLVALEALTAWSSQAPDTNLTVTARCAGLEQSAMLQPGVKIPDVMKMKPGEQLTVSVQGTGCALVQATRAYNILSTDATPRDKQLSVQVSVHTDGPFDCDSNVTNCFCAAVIEACVIWTGSFPEMALLEVTLPGGFGADAQLLYSQLHKSTTLLRRIELPPSSSRATFYLGTRDGSDTSGHVGHQCFKIHATGPKVKTRPAYAKVQDYYVPSINDTQIYTIPEECPPRIVHESNEYRSSDNLYTKARSADSDDIVITHEFSFEDIPEGIPLEDPLIYDHLTDSENYRTTPEAQQEVEKLELHTEKYKVLSVENYNNSNNNIVAENVRALDSTDPEHSDFDDAVVGYFSENEASVTGFVNKDSIFGKGVEKEHNFIGSKTNEGKTTQYYHTGIVNDRTVEGELAHKNLEDVVAETINYGKEKDQSNIDFDVSDATYNAADNNGSNMDQIENYVVSSAQKINDKTESTHSSSKTNGIYSHFVNDAAGNHDMDSISSANIKASENSVKNTYNQNNFTSIKIRINGTAGYNYNNFNSKVNTEKEPNNIAIENNMSKDDTNIDQQRPVTKLTQSQNIANAVKIQTNKNSKDESQMDNRNNILQEIDSLNHFARNQLNKTKSKYDVHEIDYKQYFIHDNDDRIVNDIDRNLDNDVDNIAEDKRRQGDIKRSYRKNATTKPIINEKLVTNTSMNTLTDQKNVENPNLSQFHVIDSEIDLDVPTGLEGPIPVSVLPPPNFVPSLTDPSRGIRYKYKQVQEPVSPVVLPPPKFYPPLKEAVSEVLLPPSNFVPPPMVSGRSRSQRYPSRPDVSSEEEREEMFDGASPFINFPPLPPHNYHRISNSYQPYPASSIQRTLGKLVPPYIAPGTDLRNLQSIYTPNGPYFYFRTENNGSNKRFFIPGR